MGCGQRFFSGGHRTGNRFILAGAAGLGARRTSGFRPHQGFGILRRIPPRQSACASKGYSPGGSNRHTRTACRPRIQLCPCMGAVVAGVWARGREPAGKIAMGTEKSSRRVAVITGGFGALGQVVAAIALEHGFDVAVLEHAAKPPVGLPSGWGRGRSCSAASISLTKRLRLLPWEL
jgi:hypothetical protein